MNPPSTISIRYCPVCNRDDRFSILKDKHYTRGRGTLCTGKIIVLIYRLDKPTEI